MVKGKRVHLVQNVAEGGKRITTEEEDWIVVLASFKRDRKTKT